MIKLDGKFTERFSPKERIVMLQLLVTADDNGTSVISYRSLASDCGMTPQVCRSTISKLEKDKEIEVENYTRLNTRLNTRRTSITICNYDNYRVGRKKTTHDLIHDLTHENKYGLQYISSIPISQVRKLKFDTDLLANTVEICEEFARLNKNLKRSVIINGKRNKKQEYIERYINLFHSDDNDNNNKKYRKFIDWLIRTTEDCFINMDVPSFGEFMNLENHSDGIEVANNMRNLENNNSYDNKYKSIYLTMRNWLIRDGKWK